MFDWQGCEPEGETALSPRQRRAARPGAEQLHHWARLEAKSPSEEEQLEERFQPQGDPRRRRFAAASLVLLLLSLAAGFVLFVHTAVR